MKTVQQIENTLIKASNGTAIRIKILHGGSATQDQAGQISKSFHPYTVDKTVTSITTTAKSLTTRTGSKALFCCKRI